MSSIKTWITCYATAGILLLAPAFAAALGPAPYSLVRTYTGSNQSWLYGWSMTPVGSDKILVGSLQDNSAGFASGAAYLMDANSGSILRTFGNPTPVSYDNFGMSSTAVGNNFLISANRDGHPPSNSEFPGAAYLYDGSTGSLLRTYTPPAPNGFQFGSVVASVGSNFLIAHDEAGSGSPLFRVTAYLYDNATGNPVSTISTGGFRSGLGTSNSYVAVSGTNVLIGTPGNNGETGAAALYSSPSGSLIRSFSNPSPTTQDNFGFTVAALPGNRYAIASPFSDQGATNAGAVYIFDGTNGSLLRTILNPSPTTDDRFGVSLAAVGNDLLIGAPYDDFGANNAGSAYLYSTTSGALLHTFRNPSPQDSDWFGENVSSLNGDYLIAAPEDNTVANQGGAVYRFQAIPEPSSLGWISLIVLGFLKFRRCSLANIFQMRSRGACRRI